jgi:Na+/melibiose symporter-like transporter
LKGGSYVYYFKNYVDKERLIYFISPILDFLSGIGINFFGADPLSAGFGLFNAGGIVFMIFGIGLSKRLADKYGKRDIFNLFLFISTLFITVFYFFTPSSVELMFAAQIGHGFFYGITIPILWAMIADVADYSEWKNNRRATAIIFSAMMVGLKGGLTIGSSLVTSILGAYGYITKETAQSQGTTIEFIPQPESVIEGTRMLVSIYPSIPFLIGCGLLLFYEINKPMEIQIETELKQRRTE